MHTKYLTRICFVLAGMALAGFAAHATSTSQYAGQESRAIKALSESDVADLLAGKGMGFAKAAELNGYPGPAHVLELSSPLALSEAQVARTREIFQRMEIEAKRAGARLVEAERELDELFKTRAATPARLASSVEKIAVLQAKVREAHLKAHIEQTRLLSQEQIEQYLRLRGYKETDGRAEHGHHPGHH
jgi:hypothetical protein